MIALSAAASVGCKRELRRLWLGFDSKGEPAAADWKFAVVSASGAQRRTLLPSHTAYKIQLSSEQTRERAVEYA